MKSSAKKIELASVDDLFSTEESRQDEQLEKIQEIPLSELHPFKDHPFKVKDDDAMIETADSIKKYGVLVPAIARPLPDGGYELVAGHRRRRASELAGKETMPVIVRDLDDDAATIIMVDSNLQRENLLPSERAFAYKMKLEAIKHQGARTDLTSVQVEQKLSARDQVAKEAGERSGIQVMRYVRLTELIPELLDMVDEKKIAFNPAYELSFLKPDEQQMLVETMKQTPKCGKRSCFLKSVPVRCVCLWAAPPRWAQAPMCRTVWWHFMIWTVRGGRETLPSARAVSSARATRIPLSMCTAM